MRCRGNSEPFPNSIYIYIFRILLRKGNPTVSFIHYDTVVIYFQILETPEEYIPQFLWMFEDQKLKIKCRISKTKLHNYPHVFMLLALYWAQTLHLNVWRPRTMENSYVIYPHWNISSSQIAESLLAMTVPAENVNFHKVPVVWSNKSQNRYFREEREVSRDMRNFALALVQAEILVVKDKLIFTSAQSMWKYVPMFPYGFIH